MRFSGPHPFTEIIPTASWEEWSTAASSIGRSYSTCLAPPRHAGSTFVLLRSWGQSDCVKPPPVSCFSSSGRCLPGTQIIPCHEVQRKYLPLHSMCPENHVTSPTYSSPQFIVLLSPCLYFSQHICFHWELARVVLRVLPLHNCLLTLLLREKLETWQIQSNPFSSINLFPRQ